jgi:prepilin-type N-terminal cleavage/methylation domain-containing protein
MPILLWERGDIGVLVRPRQSRAGSMLKMGMNWGTRDRGFTLLEVVLVLAILAVLAAIGIPRLSRGSGGASDAVVEADTETLQKAIDLYAAEHHGQYPDTAGIADQLTQYTDMAGQTRAANDSTHIYGPYLRAIPPLPVGRRKGSTGIAAADAQSVGWIYTQIKGEIRANTSVGPVEVNATEITP